MQKFFSEAAAFVAKERKKRAWTKAVLAMACVVVFCTTYALILPAITLDSDAVYCGLEEHTHTEDCYTYELTCGLEESEEHTHTDACYTKVLTCGLEEHVHTDECYIDTTADVETASDWEATLPQELTGVWSDDLIAAAQSQLGYTESTANYSIADDGTHMGYTRYGQWYGDPYGAWDAMFVSFCLNYAGIPAESMPQAADVQDWIATLSGEDYQLYVEAQYYEPKAGDLVFLDTDGDGEADHVGIVSAYKDASLFSDAKITTIEGDREDKVSTASYSIDDASIIGYAALPANPDAPVTLSDEIATLAVTAGETYAIVAQSSSGAYAMTVQSTTTGNTTSYTLSAQSVLELDTSDGNSSITVSSGSVDSVAIWTLEQSGNNYYIAYKVTSGNTPTTYYLRYANNSLSLSNSQNNATTFTVSGNDSSGYTISTTAGRNTYYLTYSGGSFTMATNNSGGSAATVYLVESDNVTESSDIIAGLTPSGTVINLFDYWVTSQDEGQVNYSATNSGNANSGINANHALKFTYGETSTDSVGTVNKWTGTAAGVLQGIVSSTLGSDGYPTLSGSSSILTGTGINNNSADRNESLAYLFDPSVAVTSGNVSYKASYSNVGGLLQLSEDGYYYYDSTQNYAEYDAATNDFILYNDWAVQYNNSNKGEFFPFNAYSTVSQNTSADSTDLNHFFGLTLTTRFVQEYDGYTDSTHSTATTFEFSGDDDVWIFVDGVLVADLGGIHDAASVEINFAAGTVKISSVYESANTTNSDVITYLDDAFEAADATPEGGWSNDLSNNHKTFANDTYHTLKFFYLERGGNASNLKLNYNLKSIPSSSIVKIDQYGDSVSDAEFALYAAEKVPNEEDASSYTYQYKLDGEDNTYTTLDGLTYTIDESGKITITSEEYKDKTITPIYYGVTDSAGNMTFVDDDNMPLSLSDLQEKADGSTNFILREVVVPTGYRVVSDEVWLYLQSNVLYCDNIYSSGAYATATALVTATNTIYLNDTAIDEKAVDTINEALGNGTAALIKGTTTASVDYYSLSGSSTTVNGTLFAVVLKYSGNSAIDDDNDAAAEMQNMSNWTPVYGNDLYGYQLATVTGTGENGAVTRDNFVSAVIETARTIYAEDSYGDTVFTLGSSGAMQVLLTELPGDLKTYYSLLAKEENATAATINANLGYTVAYYWTTASSLEEATASNTYRVNAEALESQSYDGFERTFGATIEVPNLVNRLFVQKVTEDEEGNTVLVNGARFAMYAVGQEDGKDEFYYIANENSTYIYLDEDTDGDNSGTAHISSSNGTEATYSIDAESGEIKVTTTTDDSTQYTIKPVQVETTNNSSAAGEEGTAVFGSSDLEQGYYCVREIYAPDGYAINSTEIEVLIDEYAVYANAGSDSDGVTVARGPGYVVAPLLKSAAYDYIDNTLTWVYAQMLVSKETKSFSEVYNALNTNNGWEYLSGYTGAGFSATTTTGTVDDALTTYLVYDPDSENTLFNYTLNSERSAETSTVDPVSTNTTETRRLYTSVGWSYYLIYQDSDYAAENIKDGAEYTTLEGDISNLFSRSTYVQVADEKVSNLEISKTVNSSVSGTTAPTDDTFTFTVNLYATATNDDGTVTAGSALTDSYTYTIYNVDKDGGRTQVENGTDTISGGTGTITLKGGQVAVIEGLPYDAYYTVTETRETYYTTTVSVNGGDSEATWTASGPLVWGTNTDGTFVNTTTVAYTNTYTQPIDITLLKVGDGNTSTPLSGAQFVLYYTEVEGDDATNYYYSYDETNGTSWETLGENKTESDYAIETGSDGTYVFYNVGAGTYYLEEIKAPDGYNLLTDVIVVTVKDGAIESAAFTGGSNTGLTIIGTDDKTTLQVSNSSGAELPNTGGVGTSWYTFGGLLMMAGAAVYWFTLRRRRGRRGDC